jgi:polyisoprenoid-binding protein YceI
MNARRHIARALLFVLLVAAPALAEVEVYVLDKPHTSVTFRIRHVVSMVEGRFTDHDGKIWIDRQNPAASKVEFTIQAASINTGNENRDKHLRSPDFFEVEKYPTITFVSTKITPKGNDTYDVTGDFTMRGITKTLTVPVRHGGFAKVGKAEKTGFDMTIRLNRKEFNINWNRAIDQGGWLLGDDVDVIIGVEANKKVEEAPAPAATPAPPAPSGR